VTAGEETTGAPLFLKVAPSGCLHLARGGEGPEVPAAAAEAIEAAFSSGTGEGLLHLASAEVERDLGPTAGFWREVAKLFLTKLSALLDLDDAAAKGLDVPLEAEEVERFLACAPPMAGIEYLSGDAVLRAWDELRRAFLDGARASGKGAEAFLRERNPLWKSVGRVFFHLAENRARPDLPFAFLATYTSRISTRGKLQHVPLGRAVQEQASAGKTEALLSLLLPVQQAAARSALLKGLVESRRVFQPQAWTPAEAHAFLREIPLYEEEGIFVRVPDWWNPRNPPRVQVGVTVGDGNAVGLGVEALLDFSVELSLEGEPITEEEWRRIAAGTGGLALVKGRWVEVDREKLGELLEHWKSVEEECGRGGISFLQGMRLLARLPAGGGEEIDGDLAAERDARWVNVEAGDWLRGVLEDLRSPPGQDVSQVATAPPPPAPRRLPRGRHGPWKDDPGPRPPPPPQARAGGTPAAGPPRHPRLAHRELEGGVRAVRAVAPRPRRPSLRARRRARCGPARHRGERPRHHDVRHAGAPALDEGHRVAARGPR
jgi:non-specific serine/threonine protein kinase